MNNNIEKDDQIVSIDVSQYEAKDSYLGILLSHISRMAHIIASDKLESANLFYMSNLIISMIPTSERRKELRDMLLAKIEEIKQDKIKEGYNPIQAKDIALSNASVWIVGETTDFITEFLSIIKENRIQIDLSDKEEALLKQVEENQKYITKLENEIKSGVKNVI